MQRLSYSFEQTLLTALQEMCHERNKHYQNQAEEKKRNITTVMLDSKDKSKINKIRKAIYEFFELDYEDMISQTKESDDSKKRKRGSDSTQEEADKAQLRKYLLPYQTFFGSAVDLDNSINSYYQPEAIPIYSNPLDVPNKPNPMLVFKYADTEQNAVDALILLVKLENVSNKKELNEFVEWFSKQCDPGSYYQTKGYQLDELQLTIEGILGNPRIFDANVIYDGKSQNTFTIYVGYKLLLGAIELMPFPTELQKCLLELINKHFELLTLNALITELEQDLAEINNTYLDETSNLENDKNETMMQYREEFEIKMALANQALQEEIIREYNENFAQNQLDYDTKCKDAKEQFDTATQVVKSSIENLAKEEALVKEKIQVLEKILSQLKAFPNFNKIICAKFSNSSINFFYNNLFDMFIKDFQLNHNEKLALIELIQSKHVTIMKDAVKEFFEFHNPGGRVLFPTYSYAKPGVIEQHTPALANKKNKNTPKKALKWAENLCQTLHPPTTGTTNTKTTQQPQTDDITIKRGPGSLT